MKVFLFKKSIYLSRFIKIKIACLNNNAIPLASNDLRNVYQQFISWGLIGLDKKRLGGTSMGAKKKSMGARMIVVGDSIGHGLLGEIG